MEVRQIDLSYSAEYAQFYATTRVYKVSVEGVASSDYESILGAGTTELEALDIMLKRVKNFQRIEKEKYERESKDNSLLTFETNKWLNGF